jgi:hypothetical protein
MIRTLASLGLLLLCGTAGAVGEAINVHGPFPYYYSGYYQYGSSPYVVVPNMKTADSSLPTMSSPYYYRNNGSGFFANPVTRRPWSLGYSTDGYHGMYYF